MVPLQGPFGPDSTLQRAPGEGLSSAHNDQFLCGENPLRRPQTARFMGILRSVRKPLVGAHRVELWTSCLSSKRSNQLSYAPKGRGSIAKGSGQFKWLEPGKA